MFRALPRSLIALFLAFPFLYLRSFLLPVTPFAVSGDEILFFSRALRVLHGQVIYRDFFELVGPGTEVIYSIGFHLFGQRAWVMQAWQILLGCGFSLVLTSIAERILEGPSVFLPMLMFLAFDFNGSVDLTHHWYSTFAALLAIRTLLSGTQEYRIALAGVFCGVATLFTQTQGVLVAISFSLYFLLTSSGAENFADLAKKLLSLLAPFTILVMGVFGYYCIRAGSHRLLFDLVVFPFMGLSGPINSPSIYFHQFPSVHSLGELAMAMPFFVVMSLVPYACLVTLYRLRTKPDGMVQARQQHLFLISLVGLALFAAVCSGPTYFRLSTVAPPAILCSVWLVEQSYSLRILRRSLQWASLSLLVWLPVHRQIQWHRTLKMPTGEVAFIDPGMWQLMSWLQPRTHPNETFFNDPAAFIYLKLQNPTNVEIVNNDKFTTQKDVSLVIASIQQAVPRYIALFPGIPETKDDQAGPFRAYVHSHYCLEQQFAISPRKYIEELWGYCPNRN